MGLVSDERGMVDCDDINQREINLSTHCQDPVSYIKNIAFNRKGSVVRGTVEQGSRHGEHTQTQNHNSPVLQQERVSGQ